MQLVEATDDNAFGQMLSIKLGDGSKTPFWLGKWIGQIPLYRLFPKKKFCADNPCVSVAQMGA